jgi:hypothetical protein
MNVGDQIRLSELIVGVYGFDSDIGLIIDKAPQSTYSEAQGYPDDYHVLVNGRVEIMGFDMEKQCEVINENR